MAKIFGHFSRPVRLSTLCVAALLFGSGFSFGNDIGLPAHYAALRDDLTSADRERVNSITKEATDFTKPEPFENMQGGASTATKPPTNNAFSQPSSNLSFAQQQDFALGDALFEKLWVSSPSSTQASDGLGPLYNARSCQSCHIKDGRGHPPDGASDAISLLLRLARPPMNAQEEREQAELYTLSFPDPTYGAQLQDIAVPGFAAEGQITLSYEEQNITLNDGEIVSLRKPTYGISDLAYGDLNPQTTLSARIANPMVGLGLLEAIHPADLIALADPDDENNDGISGRISLVRHPLTKEISIGRFGWKAQNPSIRTQSAAAFAGDIGLSTDDLPLHFGDCTTAQEACLKLPHGAQKNLGQSEAPEPVLSLVTFYAQNLAVPARRDVDDPQVLFGKSLFYQSGCTNCHTPKFVTRRDAINGHQAFQLIWPYSDLLLHDMGEGLADNQRVGIASGAEWRTPPLWGIGLTEKVNGHTFFLHDGRARNLVEAIMWHGGEAQQARDNFANLSKNERDALIRFLESL